MADKFCEWKRIKDHVYENIGGNLSECTEVLVRVGHATSDASITLRDFKAVWQEVTFRGKKYPKNRGICPRGSVTIEVLPLK
jgi:hypothetical protein